MHCAGKMDPGELMETVTFGCEKIFRSTDREITDAEMETIVQASLDGTAAEPDAPEDDSGRRSRVPRERGRTSSEPRPLLMFRGRKKGRDVGGAAGGMREWVGE